MEPLRRLGASLRRERLGEELEAEMQAHVSARAAELEAEGVSAGQALTQARREFGNAFRAAESTRETWGWRWLDSLAWDMRYALRQLRLNPGFSIMAVGMLALGIGVNAMVFSIVNAVLFKGFALVRDNPSLVYASSFEGCCVSYPDYLDWKAQATLFDGMEITHGMSAKFGGLTAPPERFDATEVSAGTFHLVGAQPFLGRDFTTEDEADGASPVAILQYDFWRERYNADPNIVGRVERINGRPTSIVGVMPQGFRFPQKCSVWLPFEKSSRVKERGNRNAWMVVARMKPGVSVEAARQEIRAIGRRQEAAYPETNKGVVPFVETYTEFMYGTNSTRLYKLLWAAVGFVLLIACANLANLLLGRSSVRSLEVSLRMALGAGRFRIVRQLLIESLLLSALGAMGGIAIAWWGLRAFTLAASQSAFMAWMSAGYVLDREALLYVVAIAIATAILFGTLPALRMAGGGSAEGLRAGGRGSTVGSSRVSAVLVTAEMALAVVLLAGAGVMMRSFVKVSSTPLGVRADRVASFNLEWPDARRLLGSSAEVEFYERLLARLESLPGVESVTMASRLPSESALREGYEVEGGETALSAPRRTGSRVLVWPNYFRTMGTSLVEGRDFTNFDRAGAEPVVLVNQTFARITWPDKSALGKRIRLAKPTPGGWLTVVGVAPDIAQDMTRPIATPIAYLPYLQTPAPGLSVAVRSAIDPEALLKPIRQAVYDVDPGVTVWRLESLEKTVRRAYWRAQFYGTLFACFALIALLLAAAGLYAVMAHAVSRRTKEIGVRIAVGGTSGDVLRLIFRQGMTPVAIGLIIGLPVSLSANRLLASQLVQVEPGDPWTLAIVAMVLIVAAVIGCGAPALRASRVDPTTALREE